MNSSKQVNIGASAQHISFSANKLQVDLTDGRRITVPLDWYPRLLNGTSSERETFEIIGGGIGIHWPLLDEDLSIAGILDGIPSMESETSLNRWLSTRNNISKSTNKE